MQKHIISVTDIQDSEIPEDLLDAYCATIFQVNAPKGSFAIRVGDLSSKTDDWLSEVKYLGAAFVTAANPRSLALDPIANEQAHARLINWAVKRNAPFEEGEGCDPDGVWPAERSLLIGFRSIDEAAAVGREFAQNALVWIVRGMPAQLLVLR